MDRGIKGLQFVIGLKPSVQNLLHIPAFAILSILWLQVLRTSQLDRRKKILLVLFVSIGFGLLNEFIQFAVPGRYPGIMDIAMNTIGSILGIILYYKLEKAGDSLINETRSTGLTG